MSRFPEEYEQSDDQILILIKVSGTSKIAKIQFYESELFIFIRIKIFWILEN